MLLIEAEPWRVMVSHAESTYPNECCGVLLGAQRDGKKVANEALALANGFDGDQRDRYQIRQEDLLRADEVARNRGLAVVGIFHSHPDCAAYFSQADLQNSCPWYSFVVLSIQNGKLHHANSFLPDWEQTHAEQEELIWRES